MCVVFLLVVCVSANLCALDLFFFVGRVSEEALCGAQGFVAYRCTVAFFSLFSYSPDRQQTTYAHTRTRETTFGNNAKNVHVLFLVDERRGVKRERETTGETGSRGAAIAD